MLELINVCKTFNPGTVNAKTALNDLNLTLNDGDFVTVIGGNGAGKSTMLNAIAGSFQIDSGKIVIDGTDVTGLPEHKRAAFLGRVFQDPMMGTAPTMQIEENLALAARRGQHRGLRWGITKAERAEYQKRLHALDLGLEDRMTAKVGLLSGGQRQALTLLMAALQQPKLLLLDEPTSQLDPIAAQNFIDAVRRLNRDFGVTVIAAEHRLEELLPISDRAVVMDGGRIIADCAPALLADSLPAGHPMEKALTASQRIFRAAGGRGVSPVSVREGRSSAVCREYLTEHAQKAGKQYVPSGEPIVSVKELCAGWGRNAPEVLRGASLRIFPGEIYAVIGGNGSSSYMEDLAYAFNVCKKALKPNGTFISLDVPKESAFGFMYLLAKEAGTFDHPSLNGVMPELPYPLELCCAGVWHSTEEKIDALKSLGFHDFDFYQTLLRNPMYTNEVVEDVVPGYQSGGYVAIIAHK